MALISDNKIFPPVIKLIGDFVRVNACTCFGRENKDSAAQCADCATGWQIPEVRQPISRSTKVFIAFCVAAPGSLALAYPTFTLSVPLSATCTIAGLLLSFALLLWSLLSLFRHWQGALFGVGCLLVAFWFLVVMADIVAAHQHRKESPKQTPQTTPVQRLNSAFAADIASPASLSSFAVARTMS